MAEATDRLERRLKKPIQFRYDDWEGTLLLGRHGNLAIIEIIEDCEMVGEHQVPTSSIPSEILDQADKELAGTSAAQ